MEENHENSEQPAVSSKPTTSNEKENAKLKVKPANELNQKLKDIKANVNKNGDVLWTAIEGFSLVLRLFFPAKSVRIHGDHQEIRGNSSENHFKSARQIAAKSTRK